MEHVVAVGENESLVHLRSGRPKRDEIVGDGKERVEDETDADSSRQFRYPLLHPVQAMPADQDHLADAGISERFKLVPEDIATPNREQTFRRVGGKWPQSTTSSGRQDKGFHRME